MLLINWTLGQEKWGNASAWIAPLLAVSADRVVPEMRCKDTLR